jgi:hypothetical protein
VATRPGLILSPLFIFPILFCLYDDHLLRKETLFDLVGEFPNEEMTTVLRMVQ